MSSISLMNFYGTLNLLQVAGRFSVTTDHTRGGRDGWVDKNAHVPHKGVTLLLGTEPLGN